MSANYLRGTEPDGSLIKDLMSTRSVELKRGWDFLYREYYPMVRELIQKNNGSNDDAADIFQDGLMILHRNIGNGRFQEESLIKTYVFSICKNLWLKELKRRRKEGDSVNEMVTDSHLETNYLINAEVVTLLLNDLKPDCRDILNQYYYINKSLAELKDIFNVNNIQSIKNKKGRCLQYLVKLFKEKGPGLTQLT